MCWGSLWNEWMEPMLFNTKYLTHFNWEKISILQPKESASLGKSSIEENASDYFLIYRCRSINWKPKFKRELSRLWIVSADSCKPWTWIVCGTCLLSSVWLILWRKSFEVWKISIEFDSFSREENEQKWSMHLIRNLWMKWRQ